MIWLALAALAAACLLPLLWMLRGTRAPRARRDAAVQLHREQLAELDRDLAEGRLPPSEHATAVLEVQRRLLAADATVDETVSRPTAGGGQDSRVGTPVLAAVILVPLAALGLYLLGGSPGLPDAPRERLVAAAQARAAEEDALLAQLRAQLARQDPRSDRGRQGYVLLGSLEEARGRWADAAQAWTTALDARFDATLAARTGEAMARAAGRVTPGAAALFRRALDAAPADAPWRGLAEQRLAEAQPG